MHLHAKLGHIYAAFNEHLRLNESCAQLERIFSSPPPSDPSLAAEVRYGFAPFLQIIKMHYCNFMLNVISYHCPHISKVVRMSLPMRWSPVGFS